jgi:uncharacterized protein
MKIAIISDTHIKEDLSGLKRFAEMDIPEVEFIIHAGDYISKEVINYFKEHKGFIGVLGNVDLLDNENKLEEVQIINLLKYRIGVFHGHGKEKSTFERVVNKFRDEKIDIVIYGHSHKPSIISKDKVLYINPGSPCSKRKERWFSYVLLTLSELEISVEFKFNQSSFFDSTKYKI